MNWKVRYLLMKNSNCGQLRGSGVEVKIADCDKIVPFKA